MGDPHPSRDPHWDLEGHPLPKGPSLGMSGTLPHPRQGILAGIGDPSPRDRGDVGDTGDTPLTGGDEEDAGAQDEAGAGAAQAAGGHADPPQQQQDGAEDREDAGGPDHPCGTPPPR